MNSTDPKPLRRSEGKTFVLSFPVRGWRTPSILWWSMQHARLSSEETSRMSDALWQEQEFVYASIGRRPFRVPRHIVQRYPESVVAAMQTEFPEFGRENDPLSVDYDVSMST